MCTRYEIVIRFAPISFDYEIQQNWITVFYGVLLCNATHPHKWWSRWAITMPSWISEFNIRVGNHLEILSSSNRRLNKVLLQMNSTMYFILIDEPPILHWSLQENVPETDQMRPDKIAVEDGSRTEVSTINQVKLVKQYFYSVLTFRFLTDSTFPPVFTITYI